MVIALLFVAMIVSGISGRVTLLSVRGGVFQGDESAKPMALVVLDLIATGVGLAAFVLSFFLVDWWWPVSALAVGYWLVGPIVVNPSTFPFFFGIRGIFPVISLVCSALICAIYFEVI